MVDHDGPDIVHVKAQRVAEKKDQENGQDEGQVKAPEVPDKVEELLPGNGLDIRRPHGSLPDMSLMKTSLRLACGLSG